jgi:HK97 family phage portal protein
MADLISLNIQYPLEKRDGGVNLNQSGISLAAGLAALGVGSFTDSNESVSERSAFDATAYLTCVRILSDAVASLPLRVYEKLPRGQRPAPQHNLYYLLTERPNPQMSAMAFFQAMMVAAVGWSNAYAQIERDNNGRPIALWPLLPHKTKPVRKDGILVFETTDTSNGLPKIIKPDDMLHVTGFTFDGLQGTPLVRMARQTIGLALVAARFGARFYANGARSQFFLQSETDLTPEDLTLMKLDVEALSTGGNTFRVGVLPNGVKIVPNSIDENALTEYINTSKYTRDEIAAMMRVPPSMLSTEKVLRASIEAQNREFLQYSLQPWLSRISQEFQYKLLLSLGRSANQYVIRHYLDGLLAADTITMTAKQTAGRMGGWLSVNDIREQLNMEPIPGGDIYITPLNYQAATEASVEEETEDDPTDTSPGSAAPTDPNAKATAAANALIKQALKPPATPPSPRSLLEPLFSDAYSRLTHREKKDSAAIAQTMTPVCNAIGDYFRGAGKPPRGFEKNSAEQKAVDKYLAGLATRLSNTTADAEFNKLYRCLVFAIEADAAEIRAKSILVEVTHED